MSEPTDSIIPDNSVPELSSEDKSSVANQILNFDSTNPPKVVEKVLFETKPLESAKPAGLPFPDLPGLGTKWLPTSDQTILKKNAKLFREHTKLLAQGKPVEEIEHENWGKWDGCQCPKCKRSRGEENKTVANVDGTVSPSPSLPNLVTEKFAGRILNLPNKFMELLARAKKQPSEVINIWKPDDDEIKIYGEFGKALSDKYLSMPDFEHKDLVIFGLWYAGEFGARLATMEMIMRAQEKSEVKK